MPSTAFTFLAAGLLAAAPALADPLPGEYRGSFTEGTRPIAVILQLTAAKAAGEDAGRLRIDEPWACGFEIKLSGETKQYTFYSLKGAGAGRCEALSSGYMRIQPWEDGIQVELFRRDEQLLQKAALKPLAKTN